LGLPIDGVWRDRWYDAGASGGRFVRSEARFRNWITADGRPGPTGEGGFPAEPGRHHLYVSPSCPWAHRTLIYGLLERLRDWIDVSVVHWFRGHDGWTFATGDGATGDRLYGHGYLRELYLRADPRYTGRVTVPVLWDRHRETIVRNGSADIVRMFDRAFDGLRGERIDWCPDALRAEIDALNAQIYETVDNGVCRAGFATTQEACEEAFDALFATLDALEERLAGRRYLLGPRPTEADWRLFTTLVRFDSVYHGHFECSLRRLVDYPNLWGWTRELFQWPGIADTVDFGHIKRHYHVSHESLNPTRIVPKGPAVDFLVPHGRGHLPADVPAWEPTS
jgi:putative glutathione S-transferase